VIKITNTYIVIDEEYANAHQDFVRDILNYLTLTDPQTKERQQMFILEEGLVKIPVGYLSFLPFDVTDILDLRTTMIPRVLFNNESITKMLGRVQNILPSVVLRKDQVISVLYALNEKSGIFQLATGSGKTEIICAIIKYWHSELNYYPNIIILEPTVKLVNQTIARLKKYGIESSEYKADRTIDGIKVTHPASLYNDLDKNKDSLATLNCIICDEGHHLSAITWRTILDSAQNLEVKLAFSASIISQDKVKFSSLLELDFDESLIVGVAGKLLINFPPAYYINQGILATPIVFRVYNAADEELPKKKSKNAYKYNGVDYQAIKKHRVGSITRSKQCALSILPFISTNCKILILAETKDFAFQILNELWQLGLGNLSRTVFGGNEYYKQGSTGEIEKEPDDPVEMLTRGEINIVIATSVMYEGADIPVLDVVVLYSVGVEQRVFIQGIGRVLRKGKSGKYAYIIDFTDDKDTILNRHSVARREMFLNIIGVKEENIFDSIQTQKILEQYLLLEKAEGANGNSNQQ